MRCAVRTLTDHRGRDLDVPLCHSADVWLEKRRVTTQVVVPTRDGNVALADLVRAAWEEATTRATLRAFRVARRAETPDAARVEDPVAADEDDQPLRVRIDPNVRVPGGTYVGFEDVEGYPNWDLREGDEVLAYEDEAGLEGPATVAHIFYESRLIYLNLDWTKIRVI